MTLLLIASTSFVVALSGALVPGPLFSITVGESLKRGFSAGPLIILGHGLLELCVVLLIFLGVTPFLQGQAARIAINAVGGGVLLIMGAMLIRDGSRAIELSLNSGSRAGIHPVFSGIIGSLSNPYWIIWWATLGMGYLLGARKYGLLGIAAFFAGHITADLLWYSIISYGVWKGRNIIGQRGYKFMLYICGIFLVVFGGWFISVAASG